MDQRSTFNENNSFIPKWPVHSSEGPMESHGLICLDANGSPLVFHHQLKKLFLLSGSGFDLADPHVVL